VRFAKFWGLFIALFLASHALLAWLGQPAWRALDQWTAHLTAGSLRLLGVAARAEESVVWSDWMSLRIIRGCTGVHQMILYVAGVAAFPAAWLRRLTGCLGGVLALTCLTQVRLVSLCFVAKFWPVHFQFVHMVVWQSLMAVMTILFWLTWVVAAGHERAA